MILFLTTTVTVTNGRIAGLSTDCPHAVSWFASNGTPVESAAVVEGRSATVDEAVKRRIFARGFRKDVQVATDLGATTERLLERSALDALAIVGKAGQIVAGFGKVEDAIGNGNAVAVIHAADGAADGKRKLAAAVRRNAKESREIPSFDAFSSQQLDLALGRLNVIHAALLDGPAGATFLARTQRLLRFRDETSAEATHENTEELRTE